MGEDQGEPVSTDSAAQLERIQQLEREVAGARACLSAAEKELAEHQKLKALGQLIGELAHELSNPLTGILGTVQIVLAAGNVRGDDRAALREVQRMGDQCKTIIENLLRFARREKPATAPLAPQVLLEEALALLRAELEAEKVELVLELDGNTPAIRGHRDYLVQALFGLARVAVRTGVVCPDQRALRVRLIPFGRAVQIEFIDKDRPFRDPSRLFDPFFTTREVEQGLSAGLSIARGIVDEHGGTVSARNEDGVGGVIAIRLPVATEGHRRISSGRHRTPVQRRALVIDDEPVIRKVVERVLADQGFATNLMSSADEARDKIKAGVAYDVILLDLRMPGEFDGYQLAEWVLDERPGLIRQVIVMSGDRLNPQYDRISRELSVLPKPFSSDELVVAVDKVMAEQSSDRIPAP